MKIKYLQGYDHYKEDAEKQRRTRYILAIANMILKR
jgi:hypothetical protein